MTMLFLGGLLGLIGTSGSGFIIVRLVTVFHLLQMVAGTMIGSYIGAKLTSKASRALLRYSMILMPVLGGTVMLLR